MPIKIHLEPCRGTFSPQYSEIHDFDFSTTADPVIQDLDPAVIANNVFPLAQPLEDDRVSYYLFSVSGGDAFFGVAGSEDDGTPEEIRANRTIWNKERRILASNAGHRLFVTDYEGGPATFSPALSGGGNNTLDPVPGETMTSSPLGASANYVGATTADVDAVVSTLAEYNTARDNLPATGGTIGIAEGSVIRGEITATGFTEANPLKIVGMGSGRPKITGAEPLTGFVQCTSADQDVTGAGFVNFYKATIPLPTDIEPHELNIHENDNQLSIANDRGAPEKAPSQFITPIETWHPAQWVSGASGEPLTGYSDPHFGTYAESELLNALIYGTHESNRTGLFEITAVNGNDITIDNTVGAIVENNGNEAKYALINIISAASAGQWGYVDNGDGTVTVYLRPTNDIAPGEVEYTARERVIDTEDMSNVTFEGLNLVQGRQIVARSGTSSIALADRKENIHFHECIMGNISCRISEGIVAINGVNNTSFTNVTMQNVLGGRAFSLGQMNKWVVDNIHINYVERQPISMFGGQGGGANPPTDNTVEPARGWSQYCLVQNFLCENSAYETHSNAANFYLGCNWVVLQHGTFRNCPAYVTPQDCSNMLCHAVDFGYNTGGNGRVFEDQTRNSTTDAILHLPNGGGLLNIVNCLALPDPARLDDTGLIQIGRPGASNTVNIVNTIAGGGGITADTNPDHFGDSISNIFIGEAQTVTTQDNLVNAATDIFTDPANGDFSYVEGSILGVAGVDPTPYVQPFIDAFAAVGIDLGPVRYADGTLIDVSDVSVGPVTIDFEYIPPPFAPGQIVEFPVGAYLHTETLVPTPATKKLTMAFRVYHIGDWEAGGRLFYMEDAGSRELISFAHSHSNRLFITFRDDTNTPVVNWGFPSNSAFNTTDTYQYHLISVDTEAGIAQHYINDQEITYNGLNVVQDGLIAGDLVAAFINASSNGGFGAAQARRFSDFSLSFTEAMDFSVEANRRKFHDAAGEPVSIGADGLLAYQQVPHIYLANDAARFNINRGTGGNLLRGGPDLVDVVSS
jgi:hypothetical protein